MIALALALAFAVIGYVRGRGMLPFAEHFLASVLWSVAAAIAASAIGYSTAYTTAIGIVTLLGMLIWLVGVIPGWGGWGLYFASWTWVWNRNDSEVPPIDWIGFKLVPFLTPGTHWTNGVRGVICMSLRGLYILPFCVAMNIGWIGVALGLSQGIVYGAMHWLAPAGRGTEYAEPTYAFLIGLAVGAKLLAGF